VGPRHRCEDAEGPSRGAPPPLRGCGGSVTWGPATAARMQRVRHVGPRHRCEDAEGPARGAPPPPQRIRGRLARSALGRRGAAASYAATRSLPGRARVGRVAEQRRPGRGLAASRSRAAQRVGLGQLRGAAAPGPGASRLAASGSRATRDSTKPAAGAPARTVTVLGNWCSCARPFPLGLGRLGESESGSP
jgi:hypothetical protein